MNATVMVLRDVMYGFVLGIAAGLCLASLEQIWTEHSRRKRHRPRKLMASRVGLPSCDPDGPCDGKRFECDMCNKPESERDYLRNSTDHTANTPGGNNATD